MDHYPRYLRRSISIKFINSFVKFYEWLRFTAGKKGNPTGKISWKGGWTYARIPEVSQDRKTPFGWRKVRGFIDQVEIKQYHLMPMGNGRLFLPAKASIRKLIKKEAGDWITVCLYEDPNPIEIPEEFITCLKDDPEAWKNFNRLSESEKKKYLEWIYSAKNIDKKVERMAKAINEISKGDY